MLVILFNYTGVFEHCGHALYFHSLSSLTGVSPQLSQTWKQSLNLCNSMFSTGLYRFI
jgi:hypothetical protein